MLRLRTGDASGHPSDGTSVVSRGLFHVPGVRAFLGCQRVLELQRGQGPRRADVLCLSAASADSIVITHGGHFDAPRESDVLVVLKSENVVV